MRTRLTTSLLPLLLLLLLPLAACSYIMKVKSSYDPHTNFGALHTYAWLPKKDTAPQDPRFDNSVVNAHVKDSANEVLQSKGFVPANGGEPDFLIAWRITSKDIAGDDNIPDYWGYYPIWQGGIGFYESPTEQGTMVVDIVDAKSKHLIWRGIGSRQVVENDSPQDRIDRIDANVKKVMEQFPPAK